MSIEMFDCLKRELDICVKTIIPSQNTAFRCTPALTGHNPRRQLFVCNQAIHTKFYSEEKEFGKGLQTLGPRLFNEKRVKVSKETVVLRRWG